jgi:hypothetical protein
VVQGGVADLVRHDVGAFCYLLREGGPDGKEKAGTQKGGTG